MPADVAVRTQNFEAPIQDTMASNVWMLVNNEFYRDVEESSHDIIWNIIYETCEGTEEFW